MLRAVIVLALLFLSFAHSPASAAAPGPDTLTAALDLSYCGDLPDDPRAHAACHACRIGGGADLPPPVAIGLSVTVIAGVAYAAMPVIASPATPTRAFNARGPPLT